MITCLRRPGRQAQTVIHPDAAGIDLASEVHYVAGPAERDPQPVRNFGPTTDQLIVLADWLQECGIRTVAMESTGVYWIPLFELLEARGLEVCLVNAQHVRHVPGRKSDVQDWFRRMRAKLGPAGAVTAGAHKLARILYTMIKTRTAFDPSKLGNPALTRQRKERSLRKQAALLGFTLQPAAAGAVA